jgi:hypothetical protein
MAGRSIADGQASLVRHITCDSLDSYLINVHRTTSGKSSRQKAGKKIRNPNVESGPADRNKLTVRENRKSEIQSTKSETISKQINPKFGKSKTPSPNEPCLEFCVFSPLDLFRVSKFEFGASMFDHLNLFRISDFEFILFSFLGELCVFARVMIGVRGLCDG